jgi:geranylgeranyl reductase family protein
MNPSYDVAVVGAGPAGSVTALMLARAGARVALLDKATFPRDKACGDLLGPRGVRLLADLGVDVPVVGRGSDMLVEGPGGGRIRLPAYPGVSYADHGAIVPRVSFDACLRDAAIAAGARPVTGRVTALSAPDDHGEMRLALAGEGNLSAGTVVGADGALSVVGRLAGLVDERHAIWGFALRAYVRADVPMPLISLLEREPGSIFPGYGWLFPGAPGQANVGIGVGTGTTRQVLPLRPALDAFIDHLKRSGDLGTSPVGRLVGGWLKMGIAGTTPARGPVLLVGDAAGLVNPLQGEGIAPALTSAVFAAQAIHNGPRSAAEEYRDLLRETFQRHSATATTLQATLLHHPRLTSMTARALTAPPLRRVVGGPWSLLWNDLLEGATPRPAATTARLLAAGTARLTARGAAARAVDRSLRDVPIP